MGEYDLDKILDTNPDSLVDIAHESDELKEWVIRKVLCYNFDDVADNFPNVMKRVALELDMREDVLEMLLAKEYFELACEIDPMSYEKFVEKDPYAAFLYFVEKGDNTECALNEIKYEQFDEKKLFDLYSKLCSMSITEEKEDYFHMASYLMGETFHRVSDYIPEIQCVAMEVMDQCTLSQIAHRIFDDNSYMDEDELMEVYALAKLANDSELLDQIYEILPNLADFPEIEEFDEVMDVAQSLIAKVSEAFDIELPKKVVKGGPKGSFATIKYSKYGGYNELKHAN